MRKNARETFHSAKGHGPKPHFDRRKAPEEWVYGLNPVLEAVRSGREVKAVFLSSGRRDKVSELEAEISSRGIKINKADNLFFDSRFAKGHQGIAALVAPPKYTDMEDLLVMPSEKGETPLFLILDCIEDPRNFGAILRVADAGGVHGVVIQAYRSASLSPEAVKASAGASEYIPVTIVPNIKHAMREMKESGIIIAGAEASSEGRIWDADLSGPLAVVIGSEGHGLRRTVKEECDMLVSLPMKGMVNSLNASVATGIIIFEIMRQRMRRMTS
ncbi:MAG: 23S rRNA (guanosine(2251)-2'-O)-methyltransferase RlmB [Nitrospira bacterium HGW-Nitrospira-1]|nr:MAG: 23S rRNA (guanosine(2251)-2'-O)-methyltransferase RlmB [Nitrospira bacterium HGW-Nitrospira-1]